jgi:hypothetical protein
MKQIYKCVPFHALKALEKLSAIMPGGGPVQAFFDSTPTQNASTTENSSNFNQIISNSETPTSMSLPDGLNVLLRAPRCQKTNRAHGCDSAAFVANVLHSTVTLFRQPIFTRDAPEQVQFRTAFRTYHASSKGRHVSFGSNTILLAYSG